MGGRKSRAVRRTPPTRALRCTSGVYRRIAGFAVQNTEQRASRGSDVEVAEQSTGQQRGGERPRKTARIPGAVSQPMRFTPSARTILSTIPR